LCATSGIPSPVSHRHIVARQHGGLTQPDNLALACWHCNLKKGPNLSGIDPETGQIAALFHPRKDKWADHFAMGMGMLLPLGVEVHGLTPVGRATVRVLGLNEDMQRMLRHEFWLEGLYGSPDT
jgi:hypothetical protein